MSGCKGTCVVCVLSYKKTDDLTLVKSSSEFVMKILKIDLCSWSDIKINTFNSRNISTITHVKSSS
jgi:hypothetical protein